MLRDKGMRVPYLKKKAPRPRRPVNPDRGMVCLSVSKKSWAAFKVLCKGKKITPSKRVMELIRQEIIAHAGIKAGGVDKGTTFF